MISWKRDLFFLQEIPETTLKGTVSRDFGTAVFYYSNPSGLFIDIRESNMSYLIFKGNTIKVSKVSN